MDVTNTQILFHLEVGGAIDLVKAELSTGVTDYALIFYPTPGAEGELWGSLDETTVTSDLKAVTTGLHIVAELIQKRYEQTHKPAYTPYTLER